MIKVRVDWHHRCPCCGTVVVVDFLGEPPDAVVCPWCGGTSSLEGCVDNGELRDYVSKAVTEIEQRARGKMAVSG